MKKSDKILKLLAVTRSGVAPTLVITLALLAAVQAHAGDSGWYSAKRAVVGSWYLALDVGPFDPNLAGFSLASLAQFHADRTFTIVDAGDFGAESFLPTVASPQYGAWRIEGRHGDPDGRRITGTSLFLEGDSENGEVFGWNKVLFTIRVIDGDRLEGSANVLFLPCDRTLPAPSPLTCPDPIANAHAFMPASPPDVPITLTRIVAGE